VCNILSSGRSSSVQQSLKMCTCLKLNQKVLCVLALLEVYIICFIIYNMPVCFVSSVFVSDSSIHTIQLSAVLKTIVDS